MSPRQALDLEGELADNEVLTYLQMISPDDLRPAPKPPVVLEVQEVGGHSSTRSYQYWRGVFGYRGSR